MFVLKKLVSRIFFPVPICLQLMAVGLICLHFRREKAGRFFIALAFVLLGMFSMDPVADTALGLLEDRCPPLKSAHVPSNIEYVVVLGAGHAGIAGLPANAKASATTVSRVAEGVRIKKLLPDAKLIVTGGKIGDKKSNARIMAGVARMLGVSPGDIVIEGKSLDTKDHVRYLTPVLGKEQFVLVTSASHMPRAVALFRAAGLKPLPSSADFKSLESKYSPWDFFPSAGALEKSRRFVYECMGIAWAKLIGQI